MRALRRCIPTLSPVFDAMALGKEVYALINAEEKVLGTSGSALGRRARCCKLKHSLWWDTRPKGALFVIMKAYLVQKRDGGLNRDLNTLEGCEEFEEFMLGVKNDLRESGMLKFVKIFVPNELPNASQLKKIAREMNAVLAISPLDDGLSHVLRSEETSFDCGDEAGFWRITETSRGGMSSKTEQRLHFWFYPDSYDTWYSDSSISGKGKAPWPVTKSKFVADDFKGPHCVGLRWLEDSHKFNEWMNELDYEFDVAQDLGATRYPWDSRAADSVKRIKVDLNSPDVEILSTEGVERIDERVTKRQVIQPHPMIAALASQVDGALVEQDEVTKDFLLAKSLRIENISAGQLPQDATPVCTTSGAAAEKSVQEHRIPTHSAWFAWKSIHSIEKEALPCFFEDDTCANADEKYIEYRNSMMRTFRSKGKFVTFEDVTTNIEGGKIEDLTRLFNFLEEWGLINWKFSAGRDVFRLHIAPVSGLPRVTSASDGTLTVQAPDLANPGKLYQFREILATTALGSHAFCHAIEARPDAPFERRSLDALFATLHSLHRGKVKFEFACNACGDTLIGQVFYHAIFIDHFNICVRCYRAGLYPEAQSSGDFVKALYPNLDEPQVDRMEVDEEWSAQEISALLEAIPRNPNEEPNWSEIASSVGSKNEEECLKFFVRMPIVDDHIAEMERSVRNAPSGVLVDEDQGALLPSAADAPFAFSQNPTMSQLEFLASMVSPRVAAAAAKCALEIFVKAASRGEDVNSVAVDANAHALVAAAVQAKILAQDEEHEIHRLLSGVLDVKVRKMDVKLQYLKTYRDALEREKNTSESQRQTSQTEFSAYLNNKDELERRYAEAKATLEELREKVSKMAPPQPAPTVVEPAPPVSTQQPTPTLTFPTQ